MFPSTCIEVPTRIDVVPMLIDEQQPRKRHMSASSVESALLEPKRQKRLQEDQSSRGAQQQSREAALCAFKNEYASQQRDDRRSFNNCVRPSNVLSPRTPVEFIQHRDKRLKRTSMRYERSNKIEDAWEFRMVQDRPSSMAFREGGEWWTQQENYSFSN
ncbi:hypothetical protein TKK_0005277 [Trichogramma kaykai]|uniref:Uncharacterized protein n=1 Tax=Trichogramma kaykai TaxID=54128 RepID=A0ABD2XJ80_9HYME